MGILMGVLICMTEECFLGGKHGNGYSYCCNLVFLKGILVSELEIFIFEKISLWLYFILCYSFTPSYMDSGGCLYTLAQF